MVLGSEKATEANSILGKSDSQPAAGLGKVFIVFIPRE